MSKAVISNQWNLCSILTRPVTIILLFYDCVDLLCEWDFGDVFYGFFYKNGEEISISLSNKT